MSKGDKVSIQLVGGPPWGFRLGGGADFGCPLEIAKLRKNSKATKAGLEEGDVVTVIDHQNVASKSHGEAMKIIELSGPTLRLEIIKGVGPSADLMSSSMMSDSMTGSQMQTSLISEPAAPARRLTPETNITVPHLDSPPRRSSTPRRGSTPRTLTVIPAATAHKAESKNSEVKPTSSTEPWTVNVTSFEFADNINSAPKPQVLHAPQPKQQPATSSLHAPQSKLPPPTSPKPKFKANTLPRKSTASQNTSCPVIPTWGSPPTDPNLHHVWDTGAPPNLDMNANVQPKAPPMFKVAKIDAKSQKWQPTSMLNISYDDPRHKFNTPGMTEPSQTSPAVPAMSQSYEEPTNMTNHYPATPQWNIPEAPPLPPAPAFPPTRRPANHIPGMVNPLICDDSQGDFGSNNIVRPNTEGEGATNKKMYSDSAFYDSPSMAYPTIQEQVAMAKEISNFLESNQNKRSRGGRMFSKRKQRADEWSMNSQGQRKDIQQTIQFDSLSSGMPTFSMQRKEFGYNQVRHHPDPIKSKLDAAELEQIQHNQDSLCKHDALPPNIAFDINQALSTSHGKAGQFFEKRKQRAEKYVVDENNRKNWQPHGTQLRAQIETPDQVPAGRPYKSPWDAAAEGKLDSAFQDMQPSPSYQSPQPAAPQINQPLNVITNQPMAQQAPLNVKYKTFKPVTPAYSPAQQGVKMAPSLNSTMPKHKTRLDMMLDRGNELAPAMSPAAAQMNGGTPSSNNFYSPGAAPQVSPAPSNLSISQSSVYSSVAPPSNRKQASFATSSLKRPKDYLQEKSALSNQNTAISAF